MKNNIYKTSRLGSMKRNGRHRSVTFCAQFIGMSPETLYRIEKISGLTSPEYCALLISLYKDKELKNAHCQKCPVTLAHKALLQRE